MTDRFVIPPPMRAVMVAHCVAALPDEGCGLFAVADDTVSRVYPTDNDDASPLAYVIPAAEHHAALVDAEANGWSLGGVFHSHPRGEAVPSERDVAAALEQDWVYVVIALEGAVRIRAWRIVDGRAVETRGTGV